MELKRKWNTGLQCLKIPYCRFKSKGHLGTAASLRWLTNNRVFVWQKLIGATRMGTFCSLVSKLRKPKHWARKKQRPKNLHKKSSLIYHFVLTLSLIFSFFQSINQSIGNPELYDPTDTCRPTSRPTVGRLSADTLPTHRYLYGFIHARSRFNTQTSTRTCR